MQKLWIANIPADTTDDELKALVARYAPEVECTAIHRVDGDGSRPAAMLTFTGKKLDTLGKLRLRLDGLYWKGRTLGCTTTLM